MQYKPFYHTDHSFISLKKRLVACSLALCTLLAFSSCGSSAEKPAASSAPASSSASTPAPTKTPSPTPSPAPTATPTPKLNKQDKDGKEVKKVKINDSHTKFTIKYTDGESCEIRTDAPDKLDTPELLSVTVEGDDLVLDIVGDKDQCLYAVYYGEGDDITEECRAKQYGNGHFTLTMEYKQTYLYRRFVVVALKEGCAPAFSNSRYIENPEALAYYDYDYPTQPSKKGLQVSERKPDDVAELGVHHSVVNITLDRLIHTSASAGDPEICYFAGGQYRLDPDYITALDKQFSALGSMGITTNAVLVLQYGSETADMIYPGATSGTHRYYALNMTDPDMVQRYAALFTFLAERYSDPEYGVTNWILGNEIGNYTEWNWSGAVSFEEYMNNYQQAFQLMYRCMRAVYSEAKCMISLDHCWNQKRSGAYTTKDVLDAFAESAEEYAPCDWWVAYHPYSEPLTDTSFWSADNRTTDSLSTECISMKNLNLLTDYIRENWGDNHKLVLSETGFSSSTQGEQVQAAAIAYAYKLSEANDMVSSLIIHRHVDEPEESKDKLALGLWTLNDTKKQSWQVYKDMDTDPTSIQFALDVIGARSWDAAV